MLTLMLASRIQSRPAAIQSEDDVGMPRVIRVVVREVVSPRVEAVAVLRVAGKQLEAAGIRTQPHAAPVLRHGSAVGMFGPSQRRPVIAEDVLVDHGLRRSFVREIDPVVETVGRTVDHGRRIQRLRHGAGTPCAPHR